MKTKYSLLASVVAVMGVSSITAQNDVNEGLNNIKETKNTVSGLVDSHLEEFKADTLPADSVEVDTVIWKFPGMVGMNAAQTFHNVYSHDGVGSTFAVDGFLILNANYAEGKHKWSNNFTMKYGVNLSSEYEHNPKVHKAIDELSLSTKYGYKASKSIYYGAMASFESHITPTYNYANIDSWFAEKLDEVEADGSLAANESPMNHVNNMFDDLDRDSIKSLGMMQNKFGNPNIVKASLGVDFVPVKYKGDLSFYVSPITGKFTFCKDDDIAPNYSMKRKDDGTYEDVRKELGALVTVDYTKVFNKKFTLVTKLEGFYAYNKETYGFSDEFKKRYHQVNKGMIQVGSGAVALDDYVNELISSNGSLQFYDGENKYDIYDKSNGWSIKWNLDLLFKLSKHIDLSVKTQLKYDKAEINYHKNIQKDDEDYVDKKIDGRDAKYTGEDYNYGYRKAFLQFWESTTLGLSYTW